EQGTMIVVSALVQQQRGERSHIHQHDVDIPVIVDVAKCRSPPAFRRNSTQRAGDILKSAVAMVEPARDGIYLGIHMTVGDENIQPPVVVHVKESSAPTHLEESWLRQLGGIAYVRKTVCPQVAVQSVGLLVEVGYKHEQ